MRTEYCRTHVVGDIEKFIAEGCLSEAVARELEKDQAFREEHPEIANASLSEGTIRPLRREQDPKIQAKAISIAEKRLNLKTPTGGKINKKLTANDVKDILMEARHPKSLTKEEQAENEKSVITETPEQIEARHEEGRKEALEQFKGFIERLGLTEDNKCVEYINSVIRESNNLWGRFE